MKTTILLVFLSSLEWGRTARVMKRGIYGDPYRSHGITHNDHQNLFIPSNKFIVPAKPTFGLQFHQPQLTYDFPSFGSFLPKFEQSGYNFQALPQTKLISNFAPFDSGYNYPVPLGPRFEEGPIPNSFDYLIPPAMRQIPIPNPKLEPGYRAPSRRILTATNQGLFYQYPGYIPEPGLLVRLPIPMARPTRIVVPQHGAIALGSGGLGYRTLPGGKVALGSGGLGLANVAMARSNPLPPNPQLGAKPAPQQISFPGFEVYQRGINNFLPASTNALTVFPQPDAQNNNPIG